MQRRPASMGPQSSSCGYCGCALAARIERKVASMGPQSGSCGYVALPFAQRIHRVASMGPQSGSCGYPIHPPSLIRATSVLQWVHSLVAVVITRSPSSVMVVSGLQWVHSLVAVVILVFRASNVKHVWASMGPQSGSCGYGRKLRPLFFGCI